MVTNAQPKFDGTRVYEGDAAVRRLGEMSLRPEYFLSALQRGHELQSRCAPVHPRTYKGQVMWAETVAELRMQLLDINDDWEIGQTDNYETSYHAQRGMAIAVLGGDGNTGLKAFDHPKLARKRGPVTARRVARNRFEQMTLDLPEVKVVRKKDELCSIWFFLAKASCNGYIYSEVSRPLSLGEDQRVDAWDERIILPGMPLSGAITPIEPDDDSKPTIYVGRK